MEVITCEQLLDLVFEELWIYEYTVQRLMYGRDWQRFPSKNQKSSIIDMLMNHVQYTDNKLTFDGEGRVNTQFPKLNFWCLFRPVRFVDRNHKDEEESERAFLDRKWSLYGFNTSMEVEKAFENMGSYISVYFWNNEKYINLRDIPLVYSYNNFFEEACDIYRPNGVKCKLGVYDFNCLIDILREMSRLSLKMSAGVEAGYIYYREEYFLYFMFIHNVIEVEVTLINRQGDIYSEEKKEFNKSYVKNNKFKDVDISNIHSDVEHNYKNPTRKVIEKALLFNNYLILIHNKYTYDSIFSWERDVGDTNIEETFRLIHGVSVFLYNDYYEQCKENYVQLCSKLQNDYMIQNINETVNKYRMSKSTILLKDGKRRKILFQMLSETEWKFNGLSVLERKIIETYRNDVLIGSKNGEVWHAIRDERTTEEILSLMKTYDFFEISSVKEYMNNERESYIAIRNAIKYLIYLSEKLNKPVVISNSSTQIAGYYTRSIQDSRDIYKEFDFLSNESLTSLLIKNPRMLADMCGDSTFYELNNQIIINENMVSKLEDQIYDSAMCMFDNEIPHKIEHRIENELECLERSGYAPILYAFIRGIKKFEHQGKQICVSSSLTNLFVLFLLGLMRENPIKHNLLLECCFGRGHDYGLYVSITISIQNIYSFIDELSIMLPDAVIAYRTNENEAYGAPVECFIIPNSSLYEYTSIYKADIKFSSKTVYFTDVNYGLSNIYHSINFEYNVEFDFIEKMQNLTGISSRSININDPDLIKKVVNSDMRGIGKLGTTEMREHIKHFCPKSFHDLAKIYGLTFRDLKTKKIVELGEENQILSSLITDREEVYEYCRSIGINTDLSFRIMESIRKGIGLNDDRREQLVKKKASEQFLFEIMNIQYLSPRGVIVNRLHWELQLAWYKINYPDIFYIVYFDSKVDYEEID